MTLLEGAHYVLGLSSIALILLNHVLVGVIAVNTFFAPPHSRLPKNHSGEPGMTDDLDTLIRKAQAQPGIAELAGVCGTKKEKRG